jgi:coenzyme PQQ synthesis protein D (PqqD)
MLDHSLIPRQGRVEAFAHDGECLLYSAVCDSAFALNRTASEIWELCDGTRTIAAIARLLGDRYAVDAQLLIEEVATVVATLRARHLIDVLASSSSPG